MHYCDNNEKLRILCRKNYFTIKGVLYNYSEYLIFNFNIVKYLWNYGCNEKIVLLLINMKYLVIKTKSIILLPMIFDIVPAFI